jgi:hypothetical protein
VVRAPLALFPRRGFVEQFIRLVQFQGRSPRKACNATRAAVELECTDRAWRFFARIGKINAYHPLHGLWAQIMDHHVWFLLCRTWHLLVEKTAVKEKSYAPRIQKPHIGR